MAETNMAADTEKFRAVKPEAPITTIGALMEAQGFFTGDGAMRCLARSAQALSNGVRAGHAIPPLVAFARRTNVLNATMDERLDDLISDHLSFLRHLADALSLEYDELDARAATYYAEDVSGE